MLLELLVSIPFWIALVTVILMSYLTEHKSSPVAWPFSILVVSLVLFYFTGGKLILTNVWLYIQGNYVSLIFKALLFLIVGALWSLYKWYFFLIKAKKEYIESTSSYKKIPSAADNKSKITAWILYWPLSLFATLLTKPITKALNFIFETLKGSYDKMTQKIFADVIVKKDN